MVGLLALTLFLVVPTWLQLNWNMGVHGWIALILGAVLTIGLGAGLMALSFYSARRGYDEQAHGGDQKKDDSRPGEHR